MQESLAADSKSIELMLVLHRRVGDTVLVSDTGDVRRAVILPMGAIRVEMARAAGFVNITMSERLAREKGLV